MNVFDLFATISLDSSKYDSGLDSAADRANTIGDRIGGALATIGKVGAAAVGAAATAITAMGAQAVGMYANFEQLEGGIETLFGTQGQSLEEYAKSVGKGVDEVTERYNTLMTAQETAMANAGEAYRTAGLNMNEYMETITAFAASLKASTDDEVEAAKVADMAVQDMSDNANKMGTSMESVQSAYMAFSKQNYTLLDNLKLGYGGTKTEMERLLKDAEKLSGVKYDISNLSDVYNAIHVIQENLGITGTTAKEAMYTIEGSSRMAKSAWDNVVLAIGRGEGVSDAFDNFLTAVFGDGSEGSGLINNIVPRVKTTMEGIANFIVNAAPIISKALPGIVDAVFPSLFETAITLVGMLVASLPNILKSLGTAAVTAVHSILAQVSKTLLGYDMFSDVSSFGDGILDILLNKVPEMYKTGRHLITEFLQGLRENINLESIEFVIDQILYGLMNGGAEITSYSLMYVSGLVKDIAEMTPEFIQMVESIITSIIEYTLTVAPQLLEDGAYLLRTVINGVLSAIPELLDGVSQVFNEMLNAATELLPLLLDIGIQVVTNLIEGILENIPSVVTTIGDLLNQLISFIFENLPMFLEKGIEMVSSLSEGVLNNAPTIISTMVDVILSLIENILNHLPEFLQKGQELIMKLIEGIVEKTPEILKTILDLIVEIIGKIAEKLPDFLTKGGEIIGQLIAGIVEMIPDVVSGTWDIINSIFDAFADVDWLELGSQVVNGLIGGLADGASAIWDAATNAASNAFNAACDFLGINSPSKLGRYIGRMFDTGIAEDIEDNAPVREAENMVKSVYDSARSAVKDIEIPITTVGGEPRQGMTVDSMIRSLYELVAQYLPGLSNQQVYLYPDKRSYVADIANDMNEALGEIAEWEAVV